MPTLRSEVSRGFSGEAPCVTPVKPALPETTYEDAVVAAANDLIAEGLAPIPVMARTKQPALTGWQHIRMKAEDVDAYFRGGPANIGVLTGAPSGGLLDVDIDDPSAIPVAQKLLPKTGRIFGRPSKPQSHWFYIGEAATRKFNDPDTGKSLVEIRAGGHFTVCPPSIHVSGEKIEYYKQGAPAKVDVKDLEFRVGLIATITTLASRWPSGTGDRQERALAIAGALCRSGMKPGQVTVVLQLVAEFGGDEEPRKRTSVVPLTVGHLEKGDPVYGWPKFAEFFGDKIAKAVQHWLGFATKSAPVTRAPAAVPSRPYEELVELVHKMPTEPKPEEVEAVLGVIAASGHGVIAQRMLMERIAEVTGLSATVLSQSLKSVGQQFKRDLASTIAERTLSEHFDGGANLIRGRDGMFYRYNGRYWEKADDEQIEKVVLGVVESSSRPADVGTAPLIKQTIALLKAKQKADGDFFGWTKEPQPVINVLNGELWLDKGGMVELRPHRADSLLPYCLDVTYDPAASCPTFDKALLEIFAGSSDPADMVRHIEEFVGYAIQPSRDIAAFFVLWGAGRNGKSRLMAAVAALMGPNTVCNQRIGSLESSRFSLGQLAGKLMLLDDDVSIGTRLPDGLLKQISERKPMTAEHKFGNTFQFTCLALPVMLCNNLPNVGDLSLGIRRRANVIPFSRVFTESEVDPTLFNRVLETELPGVLNRALEGLQRLRGRGGFAVPADCAKAARDWLVMANPLPAFIDERCIANPSGSCRTAEFYRRYQDWARENGIRSIIGGNHIKSALRDLGYELREVRGYPEVKGLLLKP